MEKEIESRGWERKRENLPKHVERHWKKKIEVSKKKYLEVRKNQSPENNAKMEITQEKTENKGQRREGQTGTHHFQNTQSCSLIKATLNSFRYFRERVWYPFSSTRIINKPLKWQAFACSTGEAHTDGLADQWRWYANRIKVCPLNPKVNVNNLPSIILHVLAEPMATVVLMSADWGAATCSALRHSICNRHESTARISCRSSLSSTCMRV